MVELSKVDKLLSGEKHSGSEQSGERPIHGRAAWQGSQSSSRKSSPGGKLVLGVKVKKKEGSSPDKSPSRMGRVTIWEGGKSCYVRDVQLEGSI